MQSSPLIAPGRARLLLDVSRLDSRATHAMNALRQTGIRRVGYFLCKGRPIALIWEGPQAAIAAQAEQLWDRSIAARVVEQAEQERLFMRELVLRQRRHRHQLA